MIYFIEGVAKLETDALDVQVDQQYVQKQLLHFSVLKGTFENEESFHHPLVNLTKNDQ